MKVGVFVEEGLPQTGGGYTIQGDLFQALVEHAQETNHEFVVFSRKHTEIAPLLKDSPVKTMSFPGTLTQRLFSNVSRGIKARRKHRKRQTRFEEVAAANDIEFIWFVGAEAMQVDLPYMAIVWDLQHRLQPWFPEVSVGGSWAHRENFYSEFLRRATFIIAGTTAGAEEIKRFYQVPPERIQILPHPTPTFALYPTDGTPDVLKKFSLPPNYLFYPAQFWAHKNHSTLLSALEILKKENSLEVPLVLVGSDKGNREYLTRLVRQMDLTEQVHFVGFVAQEDLLQLYRHALALTYVSYFGPENLPPLEAFALGCPVIAAAVSGSEEQLGNSALLVNPKDAHAIARAIAELHQNADLRATLIAKGKTKATSWTATHFVRGVFSILDSFEVVRRCWDK
ncbi:MAG: glycosyltransferase family 1 protein [Blastocatellia bacterium]|nr:MAG: glycosyltransferase family 1 protein [Blastocatellia bacterium]